jgi:hypothetical protein
MEVINRQEMIKDYQELIITISISINQTQNQNNTCNNYIKINLIVLCNKNKDKKEWKNNS